MTTLAEHTVETDRGYERTRATVMEARHGGEDYWFVFSTAEGLEAVIPFDRVEFDYHGDETVRTIRFLRTDPRRPPMEVGQLEGGAADWGQDVISTLSELSRSDR